MLNLYKNYYIIHYISVGFSTILTAISVALNQSKITKKTLEAIDRQPAVKGDLTRTSILALALVETSALLGFIGSILLYFYEPQNIYQAISSIGYAISISIPGFIIATASAMPAQEALYAISRQIFISKKITNFMLLVQSLIQTPVIFGFIIALIIINQLNNVNTLGQAIVIISSGLCISIGSFGPGFGVGYFAKLACESIGRNKFAYSNITSFAIISQAIIETPVIFSVIISFWLLKAASEPIDYSILNVIYLAVPIVMGLGTIGSGLGSSRVASSACIKIADNPQNYTIISRTSLIAQGIIDTGAIYAFIIALSIILKIL